MKHTTPEMLLRLRREPLLLK